MKYLIIIILLVYFTLGCIGGPISVEKNASRFDDISEMSNVEESFMQSRNKTSEICKLSVEDIERMCDNQVREIDIIDNRLQNSNNTNCTGNIYISFELYEIINGTRVPVDETTCLYKLSNDSEGIRTIIWFGVDYGKSDLNYRREQLSLEYENVDFKDDAIIYGAPGIWTVEFIDKGNLFLVSVQSYESSEDDPNHCLSREKVLELAEKFVE
ncbi:MAG: hypothetical protein PHQ80_00995 [Candidatus ainarchaeum sp.]|nr:hypothetical protein [Candidatus ainarchaeum sp.]